MDAEIIKVRDAVKLLRSRGWTVEPPDVDDGDYPFEAAWDAYQKKVGDKSKLKAKWNRLPRKTRKVIMEHIPKYVASTPDKIFRKNFSTYLNNKAWNDEILPCNGRQQQPTKQQAMSDIFAQHQQQQSQAAGHPAVEGEIPDPF